MQESRGWASLKGNQSNRHTERHRSDHVGGVIYDVKGSACSCCSFSARTMAADCWLEHFQSADWAWKAPGWMTRTKDEQQCLHSFMEASHEVELLNPRKPALCGSGKAFFQGNAIRVPLVKDWGLKHSRIHRMSIDFRPLSLQSPICWNNFQRLWKLKWVRLTFSTALSLWCTTTTVALN